MKVNIIYSCEPDFAYTWFSKHHFKDAHDAFKMFWNIKATADQKNYLDVSDFALFVSKYAKDIRKTPLSV